MSIRNSAASDARLYKGTWSSVLVSILVIVTLVIIWVTLQQRRDQNLSETFAHEVHRISTKVDERVSAYGSVSGIL